MVACHGLDGNWEIIVVQASSVTSNKTIYASLPTCTKFETEQKITFFQLVMDDVLSPLQVQRGHREEHCFKSLVTAS